RNQRVAHAAVPGQRVGDVLLGCASDRLRRHRHIIWLEFTIVIRQYYAAGGRRWYGRASAADQTHRGDAFHRQSTDQNSYKATYQVAVTEGFRTARQLALSGLAAVSQGGLIRKRLGNVYQAG